MTTAATQGFEQRVQQEISQQFNAAINAAQENQNRLYVAQAQDIESWKRDIQQTFRSVASNVQLQQFTEQRLQAETQIKSQIDTMAAVQFQFQQQYLQEIQARNTVDEQMKQTIQTVNKSIVNLNRRLTVSEGKETEREQRGNTLLSELSQLIPTQNRTLQKFDRNTADLRNQF